MRRSTGHAALRWASRNKVACTILAGLAVMGLFAVSQSSIAIMAVARFGSSFNQIADSNLPNLIAASQLSALGEKLVGMASEFAAADSQMRRQATADRCNEQLIALRTAVDRIEQTTGDHERVREVRSLFERLTISLHDLDDLTRQRIDTNVAFAADMARLPDLATRVRRVADEGMLAEQANGPAVGGPADHTRSIAWSMTALESVTLLLSAPSIRATSRIDRVKPELTSLIATMNGLRDGLPPAMRSEIDTMQQDIVQFGTGDASVLETRRAQIETALATQAALRIIEQTSERFNASVSDILRATQQEIHGRSEYFHRMVWYFSVLIAATSLVCIVAGGSIFLYVRRAVIGRLSDVQDYMRAQVEGRTAAISTAGQDEIAEIAKTTHFFVTRIAAARQAEEAASRTIEAAYQEQARLMHELSDRNEELGQSQAELRRQLRRMEAELIEAHDQQLSMVPDTFPRPADGLPVDVHAAMRPAREVGGDFYDCFEVDSGTLCIAVGDVSGKGLPAALFMARARSLLRAVTLLLKQYLGRTPAAHEVVHVMNEELCKNNVLCNFLTLFIGLFDAASGTLRYVNAGHVRPYVLPRDADPFEYSLPADVPIGFEPEAAFHVGSLALAPGDALVVISDGVHDMETTSGVAFGRGATLRCLAEAPDRHAEPLVAHLMDALVAHGQGAGQTDDITVLALHLN